MGGNSLLKRGGESLQGLVKGESWMSSYLSLAYTQPRGQQLNNMTGETYE